MYVLNKNRTMDNVQKKNNCKRKKCLNPEAIPEQAGRNTFVARTFTNFFWISASHCSDYE
jgi:hypothetical protein